MEMRKDDNRKEEEIHEPLSIVSLCVFSSLSLSLSLIFIPMYSTSRSCLHSVALSLLHSLS